MHVRYDARADAAGQGATHLPSFEEWLQSYPKLGEALQACCLRFVITLPEESLRDAPRLCFELQEAYWFYLDYIYEGAKRDLPKLNQMNFCSLMLESSDLLRSIYQSQKDKQQLFQSWREYCRRVPLRGAVLFNARLDKCLMVQPWKGDKWTYPRGKINEDESECDCAIREVWEETGIDISGRVVQEQSVAADVYGTGHAVKLFLVPGIPEEVPCAPHTRKEISKIGWIHLTKLPGWDPGGAPATLRFFGVEPFVADIRRWVEERLSVAGAIGCPGASQRGRPKAAAVQRAASSAVARTRREPPGSSSHPPPPVEAAATESRPPQRGRPAPAEEAARDSRAPQRGRPAPVEDAAGESRPPLRGRPVPVEDPAARESRPPQRGRHHAPVEDVAGESRPPQRGRRRAAHTAVSKEAALLCEAFFSLDLSKVMQEFDRGWELPARVGRC